MMHKRILLFCSMMLVLVALFGLVVESATRELAHNEILQSQQLRKHLETLKGHLEDTIEKLDHNIRARQAEFDTEVQTPDGEYLEAALGSQRNDLISAAAIPQISLPLQNLRKSQNSGLRR